MRKYVGTKNYQKLKKKKSQEEVKSQNNTECSNENYYQKQINYFFGL